MKNDLFKQVSEVMHAPQTFVYVDQTIDEALDTLRKRNVDCRVIYIYVVDRDQILKGVVATRVLLLKEGHTPISQVMIRDIITLHGHETLEKALHILEDQKLLAIPVVGDLGKLEGIIDVDHYLEEVIDLANTQRRSDIFQMIGLHIEEGKKQPFWKQYKLRMPWMFCNMIGGLTCAVISRAFEQVLARALLLAMFIPLVLTLAESISMQSMTQSLELIRSKARPYKRIMKESTVILLIALTSAIVIGSLSLLWEDGGKPAITIGIGIFLSVYLSSLLGTFIPFLLHSYIKDAKVASGPVVLTITDVMTTTIYLGIGTYLIL